MKTLIFPAGTKEGDDYVRLAQQRGEECYAVMPDSLPPIHDPAFAEVFTSSNKEIGITHLLCPAASIHKFMETFPHGLVLLGESPIQRQMREHRELMARVDRLINPMCRLTRVEVAGVLRQASLIYGESNDEKIVAMMAVCAGAQSKGSIIEIGSLCGRTAFVLGWLAFKFGLGPVRTIDPWSASEGIQKDCSATLAAMTEEWDWEVVAESYAVNTAVLVTRNLSHDRRPSVEAARSFPNGISVLHIDGNHDYAAVSEDIRRWVPKLVSGGWLILDDYFWAHGDGPRRIGDELLERGAHDIHFVAGNALFARMK